MFYVVALARPSHFHDSIKAGRTVMLRIGLQRAPRSHERACLDAQYTQYTLVNSCVGCSWPRHQAVIIPFCSAAQYRERALYACTQCAEAWQWTCRSTCKYNFRTAWLQHQAYQHNADLCHRNQGDDTSHDRG